MLTKKGTEQNLSSPNKPQNSGKSQPRSASGALARLKIFFGAIVFLAALMGSAFFLNRSYHSHNQNTSAKLSSSISKDLSQLKQKNALPDSFSDLSNFEVTTENSTNKNWIKNLKINFPTTEKGKHVLELFIFFVSDENKISANVQYDLIEQKSKNTEWELTRKYDLGPAE